MATARQPERPLCTFFARGLCTFGDTCRFSHSSLRKEPPASNSKNVCPHFVRGTCRFGERCMRWHPTETTKRQATQNASLNLLEKKPTGAKANDTVCSYYIQGICRFGAHCANRHPLPDDSPSSRPASILKSSLLRTSNTPQLSHPHASNTTDPHVSLPVVAFAERSEFQCTVRFGASAAVEEVLTAFESRKVILSSLPPQTSVPEVTALVADIHPSPTVVIYTSSASGPTTASIEFLTTQQALHCVSLLDRHEFGGNKLAARLDAKGGSSDGAKSMSLGRKVKISWWIPKASAVAYYNTASLAARKARQLNGKTFNGHEIKTSYNGVIHRQSVLIHNLPLGCSEIHLQRFCSSEGVSIRQREEDAIPIPNVVRALLEIYGSLEAYDAIPVLKTDTKAIAFARFTSADAATKATSALHDKPQDFLQGKPLWLQQVFALKYTLRARHLNKIQEDLKALETRFHPNARSKAYTTDSTGKPLDPVTLSIDASNRETLHRIMVEAEKVVLGELLCEEGTTKAAWDPFFSTADGVAFIYSLNADDSHRFYVICNGRNRTVRIVGSQSHRSVAKATILKKLAQLRLQRHIIPLEKDLLWYFVKGGLERLRQEMGNENISLDIVGRALKVIGGDGIVEQTTRFIAQIRDTAQRPGAALIPSTMDSECPACFTTVANPISLPCGHIFCSECLQLYLSSACTDFKAISCPAERSHGQDAASSSMCQERIPYPIIRQLLSPDEETALLRASFLAHIHAMPDEYHFCPSPDCEMVYRTRKIDKVEEGSPVLQCLSCLMEICTVCHVLAHEGLSCQDYQDRKGEGFDAFKRWREENANVKECPKCRATIEKNGGCNHMTCGICRVHICWICMQTFEEEDTGGGVYAHIRRVHGENALFRR